MKQYFYRKAYRQLLDWKENFADSYAVLLEGARRVGKTTIVRQFAEKEYDSYIMIDFSNASSDITSCFDDISDLCKCPYKNVQKEENKNVQFSSSALVYSTDLFSPSICKMDP